MKSPAYPAAVPRARNASVLRNAAARCLPLLLYIPLATYERARNLEGRWRLPREEDSPLLLCRYFSIDVQNFYKLPEECNKRARPVSY